MKWFAAALVILLAGCEDGGRTEAAASNLLDKTHLGGWKPVVIPGQGRTEIAESLIRLSAGKPMTGVVFADWEKLGLPRTRYEVVFEARRVEGNDFFAALTFPVGNAHLSFINGGWGGGTTGLSNIDALTAVENSTGSVQRYEVGVWHRFRIEVRPETIKVWMDDRIIINAGLQGHMVDLRPGDIEKCAPFGFASYGTAGEMRRVEVRKLEP